VSLVQKWKSFWFGPSDDSYESEDFDDLFETRDDICATNGQLALDKPRSDIQRIGRFSSNKVIDHPNAQPSSEVKVFEPRTYDEALEITEDLRGRKAILVNLHMLDSEQAQRIIDFLAGATHAIDGQQQRVAEGVFLFAPASVVITAESHSSKAIKDVFWTKTQLS
jgi:FtsZ-interacting cell division protein YlmF